MKKINEAKKKKTINDLLDKKFERLEKIVGGGNSSGACSASRDCTGVVTAV